MAAKKPNGNAKPKAAKSKPAKTSPSATMESAQREALKAGWDLATFQKLMELAGQYGPLLWTVVNQLIEVFNNQGGDLESTRTAMKHTECPTELKNCLCEAEMQALDTLALVMIARHMACCEEEEVPYDE